MSRRRSSILITVLAALLLPATAAPAAEIIDDFSQGGWRASNRKAPARVTCATNRLVVEDLPGGQVTWGTSVSKMFRNVELGDDDFLVVRVAEASSGVGVKLSGGEKRPKSAIGGADGPGIIIVPILKATGWQAGTGDLVVSLYARGDASSVTFEYLKITSRLTAEEKRTLTEQENARPRISPAPPHAGLAALAARRGKKAHRADPQDGERTVYKDPVTGHEVWRMTDHPAIERHIYYDILAWNADGSILMWMSRREGKGYWLMDADGTNFRPLPAPEDGTRLRSPHLSPTDPYRLFYPRAEEDRIRVMAMDIRTGGVAEVVSVPFGMKMDTRPFTELPPPHPDGRHFLLRWGKMDRDPSTLVVVDAQTGNHWKVDAGMSTHRVRFTKHKDLSVFVNCNWDIEDPKKKKRTDWVLGLDGTRWQLPLGGGHPDWSPDGAWFAAFGGGGIRMASHDGSVAKMLVKTGAGGHGGFSITTGEYHVADAPRAGPYGNLVYVTELATGSVTPIAYHGSSYSGWKSGVPDPEATHPAPICSPDETKIVYDSDILGQPDVWVAVWKRPAPPRDVSFDNGALTWTPPVLHREIRGYSIHRKAPDGYWELVRDVEAAPVRDLPSGRYAVASLEWSGLESRYALAGSDALTSDTAAAQMPPAPRLIEAGPTHVSLEWAASEEKDLAHYNVYASTDPQAGASLATLVGSPKYSRLVDWGLPPATTRHYRVTAVDRQGHESVPSLALAARTLDEGAR